MSPKKHSQRHDAAAARQSPPRREAASAEPSSAQARQEAVIRRAAVAPGSLRPRDVLQLQRAVGNRAVAKLLARTARPRPSQKNENETSLPDSLKVGLEALSGLPVDDLRVHYNSPEPARLQALAYTRGTDIHLGPGQEKHLMHEAWHAVQQKQGRVQPTAQLEGAAVNENAALESEADVMGRRATVGASSAAPRAESAAASAWATRAGAPPVQLKKMNEVMAEQYERELEVNAPEYRKAEGTGRYTTVGFEWDIAKTVEHSDEHENILQGLSHVELAESDFKLNGLPYLLETDAGNVLEFVTPPFYLQTRVGSEVLPTLKELTDIIGATREALQELVKQDNTIGALMAKDWNATFRIGSWEMNDIAGEVDWRNWSWRAQSGEEIETALRGKDAVKDISLAKVTVDGEPQINVATDVATFSRVQDPEAARVGESDIKATVDDAIGKMGRVIVPMFKDAPQPARLAPFIDHLVRVLAQQHAVPYIKKLAEMEKQGWQGEELNALDMERIANSASYVKDMTNVWLKTDLVSLGVATLSHEDWPVVHGALKKLHGLLPEDKFPIGEIRSRVKWATKDEIREEVRGYMTGVAKELLDTAERLQATKKGKYGEEALAVLKEVAGQHRAYNEHNPKVLGVRQDTFINADVMRALSGRLNFNKMLFVMEVREGGQFLEWLKKDEKSSGKKTEEPTTETTTEHPLLSLSDATSKTTSGSKDRSRETFKDYQVKKARWAEFLEALSAVAVADEDIVAFQHQAPEAIDPSLMFIEAEPPSKPTVKPSAKKTEVSDKSSTEKPKVTGKSSKEEAEGSKESSAKKSVSSKKAIRASDFNIIPNPGGGDCLFHALAGKNLSPRSMLRIRKTVAALRNGMPENQALNAQNVAAALFQTLSDRKARELITGRHNIPNDVYALLQAVPGIYAGEDELIQWCRLTNRRVTVVDSNGTLAIFSRGGRHPIPVTLENIHAKARRAIDGTNLALYKTPNHWERISGTNF